MAIIVFFISCAIVFIFNTVFVAWAFMPIRELLFISIPLFLISLFALAKYTKAKNINLKMVLAGFLISAVMFHWAYSVNIDLLELLLISATTFSVYSLAFFILFYLISKKTRA